MSALRRIPPVLAVIVGALACSDPTLTSVERTAGPAADASADALSTGVLAEGGVSLIDPNDDASCAQQTFEAKGLPLDIYLLVDATGSMNTKDVGPGGTRWSVARGAIGAFLKDPRSAGIGAGMQVFPYTLLCNTDSDCVFSKRCNRFAAGHLACQSDVCASDIYSLPAVAIGDVATSSAAIDAVLAGRDPGGSNNDASALAGTYQYIRQYATVHPDRRTALVYVTDGLPIPGACLDNSVDLVIAEITKARAASPAIPTYVVGILGSKDDDHDPAQRAFLGEALAGGAAPAFVVETASDLADKLLLALNQIRGQALPCEYPLPTGSSSDRLDTGRVNLSFTSSSGDTTIIGNARDAASCSPTLGGWYYNAPPPGASMPMTVTACPATCDRLKADAGGKVEVRIGCKTVLIP